MANTKSAIKRIRTSEKRHQRNQAVKSATRTYVRKARTAIVRNAGEAHDDIIAAISALDKAAKKGVIHANNAARRKSRLMKRYNAALPSATAPVVEAATAEPAPKKTRAKSGTTKRATTKTSGTKSATTKTGAAKSGAAKTGAAKSGATKNATTKSGATKGVTTKSGDSKGATPKSATAKSPTTRTRTKKTETTTES